MSLDNESEHDEIYFDPDVERVIWPGDIEKMESDLERKTRRFPIIGEFIKKYLNFKLTGNYK